MALATFLRASRASLHIGGTVRVVLGNEAADLDSMVCSVVLARFLSVVEPEIKPLAVINIARADFALRTEAAFMFDKVGVDLADLIFVDEIDLLSLKNSNSVEFILVDHNRMASHQTEFVPLVRRVIDHHKDENLFLEAKTNIQLVGSCATLITEEITSNSNSKFSLSPEETELLLATILTDTINLDASKGRSTKQDEQAVDKLLTMCPSLDRGKLFEDVMKAKFDVSQLSTTDLLRKDYKEAMLGFTQCGVASITTSLDDLIARGDMQKHLQTFCDDKKIDILVLMFAYHHPTFSRELAVFQPCGLPASASQLFSHVWTFLMESELKLEARELPNFPGYGAKQLALEKSRKVVLPLLASYFTSPAFRKTILRVIGLTGGIGCGKSTARKHAATLGAKCVDADLLGHQVYEPGSEAFYQVEKTFGPEVVGADGRIDRKVLGGKVFSSKLEMKKLTDIVWPAIAKLLEIELNQLGKETLKSTLSSTQDTPLTTPVPVIVEAAVLVEAGWTSLCDEIWVCCSSEDTACKRLKSRGLELAEALKRIRAQITEEERKQHATTIIDNNTDLANLHLQVEKQLKKGK
eukprot:m.97476 g.97476  ORF g.97476 m.97476 type:complete len:581 (-) comp22044_c0_seq3:47-1789(-)